MTVGYPNRNVHLAARNLFRYQITEMRKIVFILLRGSLRMKIRPCHSSVLTLQLLPNSLRVKLKLLKWLHSSPYLMQLRFLLLTLQFFLHWSLSFLSKSIVILWPSGFTALPLPGALPCHSLSLTSFNSLLTSHLLSEALPNYLT